MRIISITTNTTISGNLTLKKPKLIATGDVFKTTKITAIKATTDPIIKFLCFSIFFYFLEANFKEISSPIDGNRLYNLAATAKLSGKFNSRLSLPKK